MNVVIVSDEPVLPALAKRPLEPLGHSVTTVASVAELESRLGELAPRAALLPRRLPDRALADAIAILRTASEPIAAIVVGVASNDRWVARDLEADGYLQVPFSDAQVLDVLGATTRAKRLVLLADDSPLIHRHTVPILEDDGYEVRSANDGEEAVALARELSPDLVITDIEMPKLDGYGVCKTLKSEPATAHVPVLICSSLGEAADLERGFDAGADDYLVKPVIPEELLTRVRALVRGALPASRERVLVVDDSLTVRDLERKLLDNQGYRVEVAVDGMDGWNAVRGGQFDLVVTDVDMPRMDGIELVSLISRDPQLRSMPVMIVSYKDRDEDRRRGLEAGAAYYLTKGSFHDETLMEAVVDLIGEARS
jgi:CheY-like chemotaxis protein